MDEVWGSEKICSWNIFDYTGKVVMGIGLYTIGMFAVVLNCWLLLVFLNGSLNCRSYFMVLNLCLVSLARSILAGFPLTGTSAIAQGWMFGDTLCKVFGFFNLFIGVYQMESITHMCIERYVAAKYVKFGWQTSPSQYALFVALCWFFTILYSLPALAVSGAFSCDLTGTSCQLNVVWQHGQAWYILAFVLLGGVKPILVIIWMLSQAKRIEKEYYTLETHLEQQILTNTVTTATQCTLACWLPQGLLISWLVIPQLLVATVLQPPLLLVLLSYLAAEMAPAVPVLVYLWQNPRIQKEMMSVWKNREGKQE